MQVVNMYRAGEYLAVKVEMDYKFKSFLYDKKCGKFYFMKYDPNRGFETGFEVMSQSILKELKNIVDHGKEYLENQKSARERILHNLIFNAPFFNGIYEERRSAERAVKKVSEALEYFS